jgi:fructosamine-3-kinase
LTPALRLSIEDALGARVTKTEPVTGGDINQAYRLELDRGPAVFVKTHGRPPEGFYEAEADGLALLRGTGAVRVPEVLAASDAETPFLALEWIASAPRGARFDEAFGRALATMHGTEREAFGHTRDNFIGRLPQPNEPMDDWPAFYRERRLVPMIAEAAPGLDREARRDLEGLLTRVDRLAATDEPPRVIHGDLWSGNVMADEKGAPCLIDPAAYAGHREIDLAMLMLFGAPSARFFAAYDEVLPRELGHEARVPLYQLYFLLVHVALFGTGYLSSVKRTLGALA